jgi:4a-hydroxytetrahydrobiopterin dehydratase
MDAQSPSVPAPHDIIFSANQPADLPHRAMNLFPEWQLTDSRKAITRQFTFSSFTKAWKFMSLVADECKAKNHHPSWSNLYNRVTIEWTTHNPNGLSSKDVDMAEFCNQKAAEIGLKE